MPDVFNYGDILGKAGRQGLALLDFFFLFFTVQGWSLVSLIFHKSCPMSWVSPNLWFTQSRKIKSNPWLSVSGHHHEHWFLSDRKIFLKVSGSAGSILSQEPSAVLGTFAKALFVSISTGIHVAVDVLDPVLFMMPWINRPVNATPQNPLLSSSSVFGNQATTRLWTTTLLNSQGYSFYHVLFRQCSPCLRKA